MIYRKDEYVQHDPEDRQFPFKQVDHLSEVEGEGERFIGRVMLNMQTNLGIQQFPVSFEIEAANIKGAFGKFAETALPKVEEMKERIASRIEEARRQAQNRIVTPDQAMGRANNIVNFDELGRDN